jgi:hypothetical protein
MNKPKLRKKAQCGKKIRKQTNLNTEEHYKIENNHYHD